MSERCDLSNLFIDECACRIHGPKESAATPTGIVISARYSGLCADIGDDIEPGELIVMRDNGRWAHVQCAP